MSPASVLSGCGDAGPSAEPRPRAADCGAVDYDAGAQVDGLAKTERVGLCEHATNEPAGAPPNAGIVNSVGTMYGTCEPPEQGEGGCSPPLQLQSTPACLKNAALYEKYPASGGITDHEKTTIRGARPRSSGAVTSRSTRVTRRSTSSPTAGAWRGRRRRG
jgi:hypothetical protein